MNTNPLLYVVALLLFFAAPFMPMLSFIAAKETGRPKLMLLGIAGFIVVAAVAALMMLPLWLS